MMILLVTGSVIIRDYGNDIEAVCNSKCFHDILSFDGNNAIKNASGSGSDYPV